MIEIAGWARDLLVSRGALVETEGDGMLRALLPPTIAGALASPEWLLLNFGSGPGADDQVEWTERLGALLSSGPQLVGARLRSRPAAPRLDTEAVLARELIVQNGVCRLIEDYAATTLYLIFRFEYTIESDDRRLGLSTICLNASADAMPPRPEFLLSAVRDELEDDPGCQAPADKMAALYAKAAAAARADVRKRLAPIEETANRRLARDTERVETYYSGLLAQIEKRIAKRAGDEAAAEKERSRLAPTELDRTAKIEDLVRKYSLRIQLELIDVLALIMPVREISVRLLRKKEERVRKLHWNVILRALDSPLCEGCSGRAHPMYLCDNVHCLCSQCWQACPGCGRFSCPACTSRCKCGRSRATPVPVKG